MHDRLEQLEAAFEAANVRVGEAIWNIYSGEAEADLDGAHCQLALLSTSPASRALVETLLAVHNYILASVIAAQAHETITARFGAEASSHPAVADYLREDFYANGNAVTWTDRIVRGTGVPLSTDAYLRKLSSRR
jgi:hypothetical protein